MAEFNAKMIVFHCECGKRFSFPPAGVRRRVKCFKCGAELPVPTQEEDVSTGTLGRLVTKLLSSTRLVVTFIVATIVIALAILITSIAIGRSHRNVAVQKRIQTELFGQAKHAIEQKNLTRARDLLQNYSRNEFAMEKPEADRLLAELEIVLTNDRLDETISGLDDAELAKVSQTKSMPNETLTHPVLVGLRQEAIAQAVQQTQVSREENTAKKRRQQEEYQAWLNEVARLRKRQSDIRFAVWGDPLDNVRWSADEWLGEWPSEMSNVVYLRGKADLCGKQADIEYSFYRNKLVRVSYAIDFGRNGNPFHHDVIVASLLEQKYGDGDSVVVGLKNGAFEVGNSSRSRRWNIPRTRIELIALSFRWDAEISKTLTLTYSSRSTDADAFFAEGERFQQERVKRGRAKDLKGL